MNAVVAGAMLQCSAPLCAYQLLRKAVFFNRGSTIGCRGFRRNKPKLSGTKSSTTVLCSCSNTDTWVIV